MLPLGIYSCCVFAVSTVQLPGPIAPVQPVGPVIPVKPVLPVGPVAPTVSENVGTPILEFAG